MTVWEYARVDCHGDHKAWQRAGERLDRTLCMEEPPEIIHVNMGRGMPLKYFRENIFADAIVYLHCNEQHPLLMFRKARDLKVKLKRYAVKDPYTIRIGVVHGGTETFIDLDRLIRVSAAKACIKNKMFGMGVCTGQSGIEFVDCRNSGRLKLTSIVQVAEPVAMKRPASSDVMSMLMNKKLKQ